MTKKTRKKVLKSVLSIMGIIALAGLSFGILAFIWGLVYQNPLRIIIGSGIVLFILLIFGVVTIKSIRKKIIDIFT